MITTFARASTSARGLDLRSRRRARARARVPFRNARFAANENPRNDPFPCVRKRPMQRDFQVVFVIRRNNRTTSLHTQRRIEVGVHQESVAFFPYVFARQRASIRCSFILFNATSRLKYTSERSSHARARAHSVMLARFVKSTLRASAVAATFRTRGTKGQVCNVQRTQREENKHHGLAQGER